MKLDDNPDVAEVIARNRETCRHPKDRRELRSIAVGSGHPGVIGCHMESIWCCGICGRQVADPAFDDLVAQVQASFDAAALEPEPACNCAGDEDAPYGGHKVRCPRYGRRPL